MPIFGKGNKPTGNSKDTPKGNSKDTLKGKSKGKGKPTCEHEATYVYVCACGTTINLGVHKRNTDNHPDIVRHHNPNDPIKGCKKLGGHVTQACRKCGSTAL